MFAGWLVRSFASWNLQQANQPTPLRFSALRGQQGPLLIEPPPITAKPAVGGHDAMARYNNSGRIGAAGLCHGPCAAGMAYLVCQLAVGRGFARWYLLQRRPYLALEDGAPQVQGRLLARRSAALDQAYDRLEGHSELLAAPEPLGAGKSLGQLGFQLFV